MITYPTLPIEISAKKSRAFLGRQIENEGRRLSVAAPHDTGAKQALEEASEWTGVATDLEVIVWSFHNPGGTPECRFELGSVEVDVLPILVGDTQPITCEAPVRDDIAENLVKHWRGRDP